MERTIEKHRLEWQGIEIEVRYEARWLNCTDPVFRVAHLEVRAIKPARNPLPFSETGDRSHFPQVEDVAHEGGPVAYVLAWLDHEAKSPAWREHAARQRQMSLF